MTAPQSDARPIGHDTTTSVQAPADDARCSRFAAAVHARHLPALDGLRAVAVVIVMLYHYTESRWIPGDLGVSIFFVLSGFLITLLLIRESANTGRVLLRAFYLRRTLRIFPAYYVYILFSWVLDTVRGHPWSRTLVFVSLTYLVNYFNATHGHPITSVAHAWSLADEEQFYLLWPAAFILLWRRPERTAIRWLIGIIVTLAIWRTFLYAEVGVGAAYVYNAFDTRADVLATGCLLAFIAQRRGIAHIVDRVSARSWYPILTIGALYVSRVFGSLLYHYTVGFTVDALLIAVCIAQLLAIAGRPAWRWLDFRVTRFFGAISYSLYLYHAWGLSFATHLVHGQALTVITACVMSTVLASGSYFIIERPFLRLKRHLERFVIGSPPMARPTVAPS